MKFLYSLAFAAVACGGFFQNFVGKTYAAGAEVDPEGEESAADEKKVNLTKGFKGLDVFNAESKVVTGSETLGCLGGLPLALGYGQFNHADSEYMPAEDCNKQVSLPTVMSSVLVSVNYTTELLWRCAMQGATGTIMAGNALVDLMFLNREEALVSRPCAHSIANANSMLRWAFYFLPRIPHLKDLKGMFAAHPNAIIKAEAGPMIDALIGSHDIAEQVQSLSAVFNSVLVHVAKLQRSLIDGKQFQKITNAEKATVADEYLKRAARASDILKEMRIKYCDFEHQQFLLTERQWKDERAWGKKADKLSPAMKKYLEGKIKAIAKNKIWALRLSQMPIDMKDLVAELSGLEKLLKAYSSKMDVVPKPVEKAEEESASEEEGKRGELPVDEEEEGEEDAA